MIPQVLHQLAATKQATGRSWRNVCDELPYASVMRWRKRQRLNLPVCQMPGPKKTVPLNPAEFYPLLRQLAPGQRRTHGIGELYRQFATAISRRQLAGLVQDLRQNQLATMKRIAWLWSGLAWSLDATEYGDHQIIPVLDLRSRYRFQPLVCQRLDGRQIAGHLEKLFRQHGAPLFLKRDNGSVFNCEAVDEVLGRFGVLPLNNPPHFPRYNGAKEKSIRDLKTALDRRMPSRPPGSSSLGLTVEITVQELNHQTRRCLKGRTACAVFHDAAQRLRWNQRQRKEIFRLLLSQFGAIIGKPVNGHHHQPATLWRVTVESWLRCQGLIHVHQKQKPNVSTTLPKIWSHN